MNLIDAYKEIVGEEPTASTILYLTKVQKVFKLDDKNALWSVVISLGFLVSFSDKIPTKLNSEIAKLQKLILWQQRNEQNKINHFNKVNKINNILIILLFVMAIIFGGIIVSLYDEVKVLNANLEQIKNK